MSDLQGIPWVMRMDNFFEAWVETLFRGLAQKTGAQVKAGRLRETVHPVIWDPPYVASQKALIPDLILEWSSTTLIVDAKYKRHWEEMQAHSWSELEQELRETHRNDLLQVMAYANLARTNNVIACLVYPCTPITWNSMQVRNRLLHKASLSIGIKNVQLWIAAIPMSISRDQVVPALTEQFRNAVAS